MSGGDLTLKGTLKKTTASAVDLYDSSGRLLGQASVDGHRRFRLSMADVDRPELLCSVRAKTGDASATVVPKGRPGACSKTPACRIVSPVGSLHVSVNTGVRFQAKAKLKDKNAGPLKLEWDFGGGSMGESAKWPNQAAFRKPTETETTVQFVRDNTRYRARFTAWDKKNRYCEDSVEVIVGTPPDTASEFQDTAGAVKAMAQTALQATPKAADNLAGNAGDKVVLPFEKRSLQCGHDTGLLPHAPLAYPYTASTINAYVYEKALQPVPLTSDKVELRYAAASNAADPAGPNSINSTSRNWPADQGASSALLKKGQLFERYERPPGANLGEGYYSSSQIDAMSGYHPINEGMHQPVADEGAYFTGLDIPINPDHGRYMPGIDGPYAANVPQPFSDFIPTDNWFSAFWLPLTDIDDSGRVNPTPLFRVEAIDKATQTLLAATDLAVTSGRDFHCRECHALGKIGANPDIARVNSSGETTPMLMAATGNSLEDEEQAALMNMDRLHAFWDFSHHYMPDMGHDPNAVIYGDGPGQCAGGPGMCHSAVTFQQIDQGFIGRERPRTDRGTMSNAMHRMHGTLQYNADRTDILREDDGSFRCKQDYAKTSCPVDPAKSLFPVKDAEGKILPMEENCLKCHSGEREQCYRDRMYTAGVTCYQCHGDMLAVAELYEKSHKNPDGNAYRMQWLDQPDCGSCHIGSGNRGKDGQNEFFSAGVKTLAFAPDDPSATPNPVDLANPDERRFAVMPLTELPQQTAGYSDVLRTPLYRMGKDRHGQVACAACHGAAHSVWPNRNPSANDNVTALELQGHTGTLLECNVCHTADAFAARDHLDEGLKVTDAKIDVLGGPHNLHPVNDRHWWNSAEGDAGNSDGSTSGGWHNDYAKLEGTAHEDQCAACHGNDHKGTRLSKTPVDRVFDYSDAPDLGRLKRKGIKPKVTVKAGTPIGCDTCHSVELSCTGSPNPQCGQASEQVTATT
ncbi:MAG: cytochrome C, partial [Methylococcaceae bacterium]|nr:cytochrome C [Methylococcaceae bacterium]